MLSISAQQMAVFEGEMERRFREELLQHIRESHPIYARIAVPMFAQLLETAVRRARRYGFTQQQTLAQFVSLMAAVAPNFDLHPAVHALLVSPAVPVDGRVEALTERLPDRIWDEVMAQGSNIGWYLAEDTFGLAPASRIVAALARAMAQTGSGIASNQLLQSVGAATAAAASHGWHSEDAVFVFSAAWLAYGTAFDGRSDAFPWVSDVFDRGSATRTQVVLLRMRLALDRQLWI